MRERNYVKKPHAARFLMTFHAAGSGLPADIDEEPNAIEFLNGGRTQTQAERERVAVEGERERQTALPSTNKEIFIRGYRILTGPGLITEKQAKWVVDIAETKANVTDNMVKSLSERLEQGFARAAASAFITKYKDWPTKEPQVTASMAESIAPGADAAEIHEAFKANTMPEVPAGRYAIVVDGVTKFYRVTLGKGRWAGKTFVEAQASDDHHPIRGYAARNAILRAIADDPDAGRRYGRELGKCSRCGRTLTDETSREYGMGPYCRNK